jgi:hypothetical protein
VPKFVWKNKNGTEKKERKLQMDNFLNHFIFFIANAYISSDKLLLMIEEGPET